MIPPPAMIAALLQAGSPCPVASLEAERWPHPTEPVIAVLCRWDPLPRWSESLWILAGIDELEEPLYGRGVEAFAWLECEGQLAAHVVDITHMGTLTDQVVIVDGDGTIRTVDTIRILPGGTYRTVAPCPAAAAPTSSRKVPRSRNVSSGRNRPVCGWPVVDPIGSGDRPAPGL